VRAVVKKSTDPSIMVYLIDGVTGTVLDKLIHRGGTGPVHMVQSENTVLYHYWNAQAHQYEVSVLELYQERDTSRPQDRNFSSYAGVVPVVLQQTYVFRTGVKCIGVTQSLKGITSKDILFGLQSDTVLSLNRQLLDPRRPTEEPTAAEREEGLIPYAPELPAESTMLITYNHTVPLLRAIVASHALIESTSLVLAYGLDLFFTRVTPSQTFDLLNEDFNYLGLIATVLIVALPIGLVYRMAKTKELKQAWK